MKGKKLLLLCMVLLLSILLTGCFKGEQSLKEIDPPKDAKAVDHKADSKEKDTESEDDKKAKEKKEDEEESDQTVVRQLYLQDVNGMLASQHVELPLPNSKEVAKQVLEYLVKGGPVNEILPNGFQAVLPEGTEILSLKLEEDGTVVVDLSEEFKNYEAKDEEKILESMTYTLTQFDNIKKMKLQINGHPLDEMPVNNTPIGKGYSRTNGINIQDTEGVDLLDSVAVTMFYPAEHNESRYYVPVTRHVELKDRDRYEAVLDVLLDGPPLQTNLVHVFNSGTMIKDTPKLEDGVLEVVFNDMILKDKDNGIVSDEVIETLVRTLTEQPAVKALDIKVADKEKLANEKGEQYNKPVTKQSISNQGKL